MPYWTYKKKDFDPDDNNREPDHGEVYYHTIGQVVAGYREESPEEPEEETEE